jgi:hypothetical protein
MADRIRRAAFAAIALPFLLLVLSGMARAATLTVSNTADSGADSLRAAIIAHASGDTIDFSVTGTITLLSTLPTITDTLTITGPTNSPGITISGGATVQLIQVNTAGTLNLQFLTLANGSVKATSGEGSGGAISSEGTLTVTNCTFVSNKATGGGDSAGGDGGAGGAIFNNGPLSVTDSTFSSNQAVGGVGTVSGTSGGSGSGGAIFNDEGPVTITNSTFSGNLATGVAGDGGGPSGDGAGGAIWNKGPGTLTITNSTFSGNQATGGPPAGGTIFDGGGTVMLKSTILAASAPDNCGGSPGFTDVGYNIADDNSCPIGSGTSVNNSTTLHLDPAGLQNNGGPTNTIALEDNSEAIHFIPVADCTDQSMPPVQLTTDQRGFPRPDPGNPDFCDAGAFELQTTPIVISATGERLQIARSTTSYDADQVNMAFTFTESGFPSCDAGDDAFNGFTVLLRSGSCGALVDDASLELMLEPWVVDAVNHQSYGTIFQSTPPETVSARMVQLAMPASPACGEWTVNIEVTGIDSYGLGNGPFALILSNPDGDTGCFDITNAIVGNQIDPPTRTVRRGVRR